jgi:hypothetical protein
MERLLVRLVECPQQQGWDEVRSREGWLVVDADVAPRFAGRPRFRRNLAEARHTFPRWHLIATGYGFGQPGRRVEQLARRGGGIHVVTGQRMEPTEGEYVTA